MTYDIDNGSRGGRRDPACARSRRTSRVHEGTAFTIDVRDAGVRRDAIARVIAWLHRIDAVFSTYRADSDISSRLDGTARRSRGWGTWAVPEPGPVSHRD